MDKHIEEAQEEEDNNRLAVRFSFALGWVEWGGS
jgi:hypothetical protein